MARATTDSKGAVPAGFAAPPISGRELELETFGPDGGVRLVIVDPGADHLGL